MLFLLSYLLHMAGTEGFDPSTFRLTGDCSTGLSYVPKNKTRRKPRSLRLFDMGAEAGVEPAPHGL